jgi:hypothetical protein
MTPNARLVGTLVYLGLAACRRQPERGCAQGSRQPLGHHGVRGDRAAGRLAAGLYGPLDLWTIDGDAIRWLGVALFVAGGALRICPVIVLGDRFSGLVTIQPGHALVTGGIYGCRP